jgi:hypothetical protein
MTNKIIIIIITTAWRVTSTGWKFPCQAGGVPSAGRKFPGQAVIEKWVIFEQERVPTIQRKNTGALRAGVKSPRTRALPYWWNVIPLLAMPLSKGLAHHKDPITN